MHFSPETLWSWTVKGLVLAVANLLDKLAIRYQWHHLFALVLSQRKSLHTIKLLQVTVTSKGGGVIMIIMDDDSYSMLFFKDVRFKHCAGLCVMIEIITCNNKSKSVG